MIRLSQIVVVEGTHDIDAVKRVVDATVMDTRGFGIFKDEALRKTLCELAQKRGVVLLTDSDAAGFAIRDYLTGAVGKEHVVQVYIPDVAGKERRKQHPSKEGKLGVEGMTDDVLREAFLRAGLGKDVPGERCYLTKAMLYEDGLSGRENSRARCAKIKQKLGLPARLSTNRLMEVLSVLLTAEEYKALVRDVSEA